MHDRSVLWIGGWSAVIGGILAIGVNLLAPRPDAEAVGDPTYLVDVAATTGGWEWIEIGVSVALLFLLVAFEAITRSIQHAVGRVWARLGLGAMLLGTVFGIAAHAVNAGLRDGADTFEPAVLNSAAFVADGLFTGWVLTYFGIGALLYGIALITSDNYATWLGWVTVVAGAAGTVASLLEFLGEAAQLTTFVLFPITSGLLTLIVLYLGVLLLRRTPTSAGSDHR